VRRAADFLIRNWPLKLGAILLATVLYSGLVLGQNVRTWTGTLPVDAVGPAAGATLLSNLDPVTQVRYRAPIDVGVVSPDSFRATVDLSRVQARPGGPSENVPVTVAALDPRIQIVDFQPRQLPVRLDPVGERLVPVTASLGTVPDGLDLGNAQIEPASVMVRGASSRVDQVTAVVARVSIDASALNVDREFDLIAVDSNGNEVPNVQIEPQRVRIRIAVARELATRTLPVAPQLTGLPAPGYHISSVIVNPLIVTVSGESTAVTQLETAVTEPIDIEGRTDDLEATVRVALPDGVSVTGSDTVRVMISIGETSGTEVFPVGIQLVGQQPGISYQFVDALPNGMRADVTLAGPTVLLDAVDSATLLATVDVTAAVPGTYTLDVTVTAPQGLEVIQLTPPQLTVVAEATSTPSPGPSP